MKGLMIFALYAFALGMMLCCRVLSFQRAQVGRECFQQCWPCAGLPLHAVDGFLLFFETKIFFMIQCLNESNEASSYIQAE